MLKKTALIMGSAVLAVAVLFTLANRPLGQLLAYFQAGASTTVKSIEDEIPDAVHDEKTEAEIRAAREQLVDRQVQLSLSQNQLQNLEAEITKLDNAITNRQSVLASAYPVLEKALAREQDEIVFVSTTFTLDDFQLEIDDLLAMQQRDESALQIKRKGFERLAQSIHDGQAALAEMKTRLLEIEQDFVVLKSRRDQAHMEADTLDLVAGATADQGSTTSQISQSVERLEGQVERLEAENDARLDLSTVEQRTSRGKLARSFNRLEALKKYAQQADSSGEAGEAPTVEGVEPDSEITAKEVVITIQADQEAGQPD